MAGCPVAPINLVAPHAGAWIETLYQLPSPSGMQVAPHAGAWIETVNPLVVTPVALSLPMRERGLKPAYGKELGLPNIVAPHAGAWIETQHWH